MPILDGFDLSVAGEEAADANRTKKRVVAKDQGLVP
jgi:hypothetical protein